MESSLLSTKNSHNSPGVHATLCGDRACRVRKIQARVRFGGCLRNPLRRSCASSARNAGERCGVSGELEDEHWRLCSTTAVHGVAGKLEAQGFVAQLKCAEESVELEAENWRLRSTTFSARSIAVELEDEKWRHSNTTLVRRVARKGEDEN